MISTYSLFLVFDHDFNIYVDFTVTKHETQTDAVTN